MPTVFTITTTEVLEICGLDTADSANIAHANRFLGNTKLQEGLENRIAPEFRVATQYEVKAGLVRLLASEVLALIAREEPSLLSPIQVAGATLGRHPDFALELRAQGRELLAPYLKRAQAAVTPDREPVGSTEVQERAFGRGELRR